MGVNFQLKIFHEKPILAAFLSGLLIAVAQSPCHLDFLIWPSLIPLISTFRIRTNWATTANIAATFGLTYIWTTHLWITTASITAWILIGTLAIFPAASVIISRFFYQLYPKNPLTPAILTAITFSTIELIRTSLAPLGVAPLAIAISPLTLLQNAKWGGQWALTFLLVFVAATIEHLLQLRSNKSETKSLYSPAATLATILAFYTGYGYLSISEKPKTDNSLTVNILSTNYKTDPSPENRWNQILWLLNNSVGFKADLTIWPEFLTDDPLSNQNLLDTIREKWNQEPGAFSLSTTHHESDKKFNATILFENQATEVQIARKHILATYWEVRPAWAISGNNRSYTPGPPNTPFLTSKNRIAVITCIEELAPHTIQNQLKWHPQFIISASSNEFTTLWGSHQQTQSARIRAIEYGLPILRASNCGFSTIFDSKGQTLLFTNQTGPNIRTLHYESNPSQTIIGKYNQNTVAIVLTLLASSILFAFESFRFAVSKQNQQ